MANLLPQYKKKEVRKEYRTRALILSLSVSGVILLIVTTLLASLYILLNSRLSDLNEINQVGLEKQEDVVKLEETIADIRVKLELLQENTQIVKLPYVMFRAVVDIKPEHVSLTRIEYPNNDQVNISGVASQRKDLEDFVLAIEEHELFLPVEYPFSNITEKQDINFSLVLKLKKEDES
ncbi:MAG: PilN domain-containing protein [Candidatus Pacebacteria bacterium]|nr:PilN domain-containing protein [Candidatus Paceibacterota bacterium]